MGTLLAACGLRPAASAHRPLARPAEPKGSDGRYSDPECRQADDELADGVDAGKQQFAVAQQLERLERERRERGESAEHANQQECARGGPMTKRSSPSREDDAEEQAARDVDDERAVGEVGRRESVHRAREQVARHRADGAAEGDEQGNSHSADSVTSG